jgi:hypothetical protein
LTQGPESGTTARLGGLEQNCPEQDKGTFGLWVLSRRPGIESRFRGGFRGMAAGCAATEDAGPALCSSADYKIMLRERPKAAGTISVPLRWRFCLVRPGCMQACVHVDFYGRIRVHIVDNSGLPGT